MDFNITYCEARLAVLVVVVVVVVFLRTVSCFKELELSDVLFKNCIISKFEIHVIFCLHSLTVFILTKLLNNLI